MVYGVTPETIYALRGFRRIDGESCLSAATGGPGCLTRILRGSAFQDKQIQDIWTEPID